MAEETRERPSEPSPVFDAVASAQKWRARFGVRGSKIGQTTVVGDANKLLGLLQKWPQYDYGNDEHENASLLKRTLRDTTTDVDLFNKLGNLLEQADRQAIIKQALEKGLAGRRILGIVAGGHLEAVCIWTILTGTGEKKQEEDANWWHQGWKQTLYIPELTSAPWNVGWPTNESGVSGAGTALVNAVKEKAKAAQCDGIGLIGHAFNMGFYQAVGFQRKPDDGFIPFFMDLRT
jgi:hypothetical protein